MKNQYAILILIVTVMLSLIVPGSLMAQDDNGACSTLVNNALSNVGHNCAGIGRNEICYGYQDVAAQFNNDATLTTPTDRADLLNLVSLQTAAFNEENAVWGISVLNMQANLPNTVPGQAVTMLLLGDVTIENEVEPANAVLFPEEPVTVQVEAITADLFAEPADFGILSPEIVGAVAAEEKLFADALSPTGVWVRVSFDYSTAYGRRATAWIYRNDLVDTALLDDLPILGPGGFSPMQAFYFSTGVGEATCNELPPSSVVIQGAADYEVVIRANGAEIHTNSTILLQTDPDNTLMTLTVLSGFARVNPHTASELIVPAGYAASVCLEGPYNLGIDGDKNDYVIGFGCEWGLDGGLGQEALTALGALEQIPSNLLNYSVVVPLQVCASGVGGAVCEYRYEEVAFEGELVDLCRQGRLAGEVCQVVAPETVIVVDDVTCEVLAENIRGAFSTNCANLGNSEICYGYNGMVASFGDAGALLQPADRQSAQYFVSARNAGFDTALDQWGVLVMNTRANLPVAFTGAVRSLLFGEAQIENQIPGDEVLVLPDEPVMVTIATETAEMFNLPPDFVLSGDWFGVGVVNEGETFPAEGISASGLWVRVAYDYETVFGHHLTAWVSRDLLVDDLAIQGLPVIEEDAQTAMQTFSFTTSTALPQCSENADFAQAAFLLIQSPPDVEIHQNVNGADVLINGTVLLQASPIQHVMRLVTLSGLARIQSDGDEWLVPAGYSAMTCLDGPFNKGQDGLLNEYVVGEHCDWQLSDALPRQNLALFNASAISAQALGYAVSLPQWVCDGGVCDYRDSNPAYTERIADLCMAGLLSESICQVIGG